MQTGDSLRGMGRIPPTPGWRIRWQCHDFHELIVVMQGRFFVRSTEEGEPIGARGGDVLVYPAGCRHEERSDDRDPVELIFFSFHGPMDGGVRAVRDLGGRMRTLALWLLQTQSAPYADLPAVQSAYFTALMAEFRRAERGVAAPNAVVDTVRAFMRSNLSAALTLEDLASVAASSKYHFVRSYRKACGVTPMADLRALRLAEAENLLRTTALPLKAIAPMVGFANEQHLSRSFRRYLGRSPRELRSAE